jgi:hypothetical protein
VLRRLADRSFVWQSLGTCKRGTDKDQQGRYDAIVR